MGNYDHLGIEIPPAILDERQRQLDVEHWTPAHDDLHDDGSLLVAGMFYHRSGAGLPISMEACTDASGEVTVEAPLGWPWLPEWWKPKSPRRDLERAGALCLAEIDRQCRFDSDADVSIVVMVLKDVVKAYRALAPEVAS